VGSSDPLMKFWDHLISGGRLKLETSNSTQRWKTRDPLLEFWDLPYISATVEATNFN